MKLGMIIFKEEELTEKLIKNLVDNNFQDMIITNGEVPSFNNSNVRIISTLRHFMNYFYDDSRIIFILIPEEKIEELSKLITNILTKNKYIFLTLAIDRIEGNIYLGIITIISIPIKRTMTIILGDIFLVLQTVITSATTSDINAPREPPIKTTYNPVTNTIKQMTFFIIPFSFKK